MIAILTSTSISRISAVICVKSIICSAKINVSTLALAVLSVLDMIYAYSD